MQINESAKKICKCKACLTINSQGRILSKRIKRQYERESTNIINALKLLHLKSKNPHISDKNFEEILEFLIVKYPLIPQLKLQYANSERSELSDIVQTIYLIQKYIKIFFDGYLYKRLLHNKIIKDERDLVLSASLDGYQIFQQHHDDNWVIMFNNNNIQPEDRVKQENLLTAAIIPGPNRHNGYMGCRFCNLRGILDLKSGVNHVYYPLNYSTTNSENVYDIENLPLRNHKSYFNKVSIWKAASDKKRRKKKL
ncbi:24288_t:CDS:2, partial [Gigaspora rosea]